MGGLVFASTPLASGKPPHVPRMSPEVYRKVSAECKLKLGTLFNNVVVPRDAPGKADYGDVDFLVEGIASDTWPREIWFKTKELLDAALHLPRGGSHSFAILHPDIPEAYVQVDVELSPGNGTPGATELFKWTAFMKGDGDLLQIIGITHRYLGLTCNDKGLHFRVKDIHTDNKKKQLLFLTRDPDEAMKFHGLDVAKYHEGFADENELFDWVTNGRFFSASIFADRTEKSNDRSRQKKRSMYAQFIEVYMPLHAGKGTSTEWTQQVVLDEALAAFDKRAGYEAMVAEHNAIKDEEQLWNKIRAVLPVEGNPLKLALRGLRRWVVFEDGEPRITEEPMLEDHPAWTASMAFGSIEKLLCWVTDNWEAIKALEKARVMVVKEAMATG
ncbi:hypothetical protein EK21DRAFT_78812 [Setomelanomma holmii]|uniref:Uncharacterized protein n=1 Tax=Setomelanomma holmii TaxID=210430 RepID=A0A9P4H0B0_9PLEO|nr:hypothetical protein EK21DRAFT_78812 [Setomelanomma holmii]